MFDKVVFAGGGHRCWWQAGFWEVLRAEIELRPRVIGAVSMGAFMACLVHANDPKRALAWFERELSGVRLNVDLLNLFRKDAPFFRQGVIYRKALRALLGGEPFRQLMWQAPEIRISHAIAPEDLSDRQVARLAWRQHRRDVKLMPRALHAASDADETMRFLPGFKRLQDCRGEREMIDLLMASACMPPLFEPAVLDEERAFSGELVDPVPVGTVADVPGQTLVLTTRIHDRKAPVFATRGRIYVQPSRALGFDPWDFTAPRHFQQAYELGQMDAASFLRTFGLGEFQGDTAFVGPMLGGGLWPGEQPGGAPKEGDARSEERGVSTSGLPSDPEPVTLVEQISAIEMESATTLSEGTVALDEAALHDRRRRRHDAPRAQGRERRADRPEVADRPSPREREADADWQEGGREQHGGVRNARGGDLDDASGASQRDVHDETREDDPGTGRIAPHARDGDERADADAGPYVRDPRTDTEIDPQTVGALTDKLFERDRRKRKQADRRTR